MSYQALVKKFEDIYYFDRALSILRWDTQTHMPSSALKSRYKTIAVLENHKKEILTSTETREQVRLALHEKLGELEAKNLSLMQEELDLALIIPSDLQEKLLEVQAEAEDEWLKARETNDAREYVSKFSKLIDLLKYKSIILAEYYDCDPYTALCKLYDPLANIETLVNAFFDLEAKADLRPKGFPASELDFSMPVSTQASLIKAVLDDIGFNSETMNLNTTLHPFCEGIYDDVRLSISYKEDDFTYALLAAVHELGHGLYDAGLPREYEALVLGRDAGMTVHESQGLLFEMYVARSEVFAKYLAKKINELDPSKVFNPEDIYQKMNETSHSLIRLTADMTAYKLHILLRYKIEKALIMGELAVTEIEAYWNNFIQEHFTCKPDSLKEGWLQDIHWTLGYFGYFPSYYLGLKLAQELWQEAESLNLTKRIEQGDFSGLREFLNKKIYSKAKLLSLGSAARSSNF